MPLYDYGCENGHIEEIRHGMNESPVIWCPTCNKQMVKQIGQGVFRLKGSGYYETDFKPTIKQRNIHKRSDSDFS